MHLLAVNTDHESDITMDYFYWLRGNRTLLQEVLRVKTSSAAFPTLLACKTNHCLLVNLLYLLTNIKYNPVI